MTKITKKTGRKSAKLHPKKLLVSSTISLAIVAASLTAFWPKSDASARSIEDLSREKEALEAQIGEAQSTVNDLRDKSNTLQNAVNTLNQEKLVIEKELEKTEVEHKKLELEIEQTEKSIKDNRRALGATLTQMSLEDDITPLERIAGSENISSALDQFEYQSAVKNSLTKRVGEIKEYKEELEVKRESLEKILVEQRFKRSELAAKEDEQAKLLAETKGEEAQYQAYIGRQQDEISKLNSQIEELRAYNARQAGNQGINVPAGVPGGGGYPGQWAYAPLNAYVDSWGLYSRQCVSYAAWKVWSTGRFVPHFGGRGNAYEWPSTTAAYSIPNGSTPRKGSVAVDPYTGCVGGFCYGHVMYVEEVYPDGRIRVSDYNYMWDGNYRIYDRTSAGLTYIYF